MKTQGMALIHAVTKDEKVKKASAWKKAKMFTAALAKKTPVLGQVISTVGNASKVWNRV